MLHGWLHKMWTQCNPKWKTGHFSQFQILNAKATYKLMQKISFLRPSDGMITWLALNIFGLKYFAVKYQIAIDANVLHLLL